MISARAARLCVPLISLVLGCAAGESGDEPVVGEVAAPIVGGGPASEGRLYGTVALIDPAVGESFCTATLVAPTLAVTAAHCVMDHDVGTGEYTSPIDPSEVNVAWGVLDANSAPPSHVVAVASVHVAGFDGDTRPDPGDNPEQLGRAEDIALLVLASPIIGQLYVLVLPSSELDNRLTTGTALTIAGYGRVALDVSSLFGVLYDGETPFVRRNETELVAGGDGRPDACGGDSGGPAYLHAGSQTFLVGAASRSSATAVVFYGQGGIWTLVPAYESWITEQSGGAYPPSPPPILADDEDEAEADGGCAVAGLVDTSGSGTAWALWLLAGAWWRARRRA